MHVGETFGSFLHSGWIAKNIGKPLKNLSFSLFSDAWKGWLRHLRSSSTRCCVYVCICCSILGMMLRHFGSVGLAMVAAWLPGWAGWLSGMRLEAPRREVPGGVEGKFRALGPYPDS